MHGRDIDQTASIEEHTELLALLSAGDAEGAVALVGHHLGEVKRKTLNHDQRGADPLLSVLDRY